MAVATARQEAEALAPRENPELVGHAGAERLFLDAVRSGRMHHAWLITGPPGIGKATLAYRIARFMFAEGSTSPAAPADLSIDSASPVFRRVAAGGHTDLLTIERGIGQRGNLRTEIVVDDVRRVGEFLHLTPGEGGWRIVIVDSADELNRHAANALLKILEEPPERALVILVSHNPGRLLPTIRSRCRTLSLSPLGQAAVKRVLSLVEPDFTGAQVKEIARLSRGSAGFALDLVRHDGLRLNSDLEAIVSTLPRLDIPLMHALAERLAPAAAEPRYRIFRELLMRWLADSIRRVAEAGKGADLALTGGRRGSLDRWLEVWEKVGRLFERADAVNLDRKQVLVAAFTAVQQASRPA